MVSHFLILITSTLKCSVVFHIEKRNSVIDCLPRMWKALGLVLSTRVEGEETIANVIKST